MLSSTGTGKTAKISFNFRKNRVSTVAKLHDGTMPAGMRSRKAPGAALVSFRFPEPDFTALKDEAELHGMSPGEYARLLVTNAVRDTDRKEVLLAVQTLKGELLFAMKNENEVLRSNVRTGVKALLMNLGKGPFDEEDLDRVLEDWFRTT